MLSLLLSLTLCWGAKSHRSIVNSARAILSTDGRTSAHRFYSNKQLWAELLTGSTDPDSLEAAMGTHYYVYDSSSPNTGQYYRNAFRHISKSTARTLLESHYLNAIRNYTSGATATAFLELGRACHYLGDIGCPPHSAGIQYPLLSFMTNYHKLFESHAKTVMTSGDARFHATSAAGYYGSFDTATYARSINDVCRIAASQKANVKTTDEAKWEVGIEHGAKVSEIYTAVLLEKFYRDVNN